MGEEPTKDLATRAFQKRVLDEFVAVRAEISAIRTEQTAMRTLGAGGMVLVYLAQDVTLGC